MFQQLLWAFMSTFLNTILILTLSLPILGTIDELPVTANELAFLKDQQP